MVLALARLPKRLGPTASNLGWTVSQFPSPHEGYIAGCTLLADNQIVLWLIFPSSTAPGSGTEFSHRQNFPMDFRVGPQQGNMCFHRHALNMEPFRGSFPEVPLACREGPSSDQDWAASVSDA